MNNGKKAGGTQRMAGLAIFTALIVVLTVLCTFVKFGPVSITLALAPIVIGAALYGAGAGAYLGFVFSLVVLLTGLFGWDGGFILMLFDMKWYGLILTVLVKGTAAGYAAGLVYRLLCRKSETRCRHSLSRRQHGTVLCGNGTVLHGHPQRHGGKRRTVRHRVHGTRTCGHQLCR